MGKKFPGILQLLDSKIFGVNADDSDDIPDLDELFDVIKQLIDKNTGFIGDIGKILNEKIDLFFNNPNAFSNDLYLLNLPSESLQPKEIKSHVTSNSRLFSISKKNSKIGKRNTLKLNPKPSTVSLEELENISEVDRINPRKSNTTGISKGLARHKKIVENINRRVSQEAKMAQRFVKVEEIMNRAMGNLTGFKSLKYLGKTSEMAKKTAELMAGHESFQQLAKSHDKMKKAMVERYQQWAKFHDKIKKARVESDQQWAKFQKMKEAMVESAQKWAKFHEIMKKDMLEPARQLAKSHEMTANAVVE